MEVLNIIGALVTVGMGCLGLFLPNRAASLVGLSAMTPAGISEFRSTFGGLFILLGLAPLLTMNPASYLVAGLAWGGAALGRIVSIIIDGTSVPKNWFAVIFEAALGILILAGAPFSFLLVTLTRT
jgi:hypothetical protein